MLGLDYIDCIFLYVWTTPNFRWSQDILTVALLHDYIITMVHI